MKRKILIAGAGSIGTVLGVLLQPDYDIILLRRSSPIGEFPIQLVGEEEIRRSVEVIGSHEKSYQVFDIVFITVQEQHTQILCEDLQATNFINNRTILVSLQNGLRAHSVIQQYFPHNPLIVGTVWWSATLVDQQKILYHRRAPTVLGIPDNAPSTSTHLEQINSVLENHFEVRTTDDILKEQRKKLLLNVVSPPLALVKQPYPEGLHLEPVRNLVHALFDEALESGNLLGWNINDRQDSRLDNFHSILISGDIPEAVERENKHKVSTQIGMEKYGGDQSNVYELLDWLQLSGSLLADEVIQLVKQQNKDYEPLDPKVFNNILEVTKFARCKRQPDQE